MRDWGLCVNPEIGASLHGCNGFFIAFRPFFFNSALPSSSSPPLPLNLESESGACSLPMPCLHFLPIPLCFVVPHAILSNVVSTHMELEQEQCCLERAPRKVQVFLKKNSVVSLKIISYLCLCSISLPLSHINY